MMQWPELHPLFSSTDFASGRASLALEDVWQQATHGTFSSTCNHMLQLHYSYWQPADATAALLLIPGRIEAGHKYLELINEALQAGYQVFVLDHQGQGASERLDPQSQIGDVHNFNDYVVDLNNFILHVVKPQTTLPLLALAHSMGGGILCRYLQQQTQQQAQQAQQALTAAIFCSPMWGIPTQPVPQAVALPLSGMISLLNKRCSQHSWYVPGQGPYQNRPFIGNDLSQCLERYQWFRSLYQQFPAYQLGGISWRWLAQALSACQQMQQGPAPQIPCLLLQAAADQVVDNAMQTSLWQRFLQSATWHTASAHHLLPEAKHELLFESDGIRAQVFKLINQFLQRLPVATATQVQPPAADIPPASRQMPDRHE